MHSTRQKQSSFKLLNFVNFVELGDELQSLNEVIQTEAWHKVIVTKMNLITNNHT